MTIAVFGATGHLGRLTIESLLDRGVPPTGILALGRNEEVLATLAAKGVATRQIDLDDPSGLGVALAGVDRVLLISGSEVGKRVAQHANAIIAAQRAGARQIVYTSAPHADDTPLILAPEHKATEELIRGSGIPFTILRNGWYTENYVQQFEHASTDGSFASSVGDGRVASAPRKDFAEAAAVVLTTEGHEGRVYELSGDVAWTFDEFAAAAAQVLGRPVSYRTLTPEEETEILTGAGLDAGTVGFIVALNGNIRDGLVAGTPGDLAQLLGRPTTPLIETLRTWA